MNYLEIFLNDIETLNIDNAVLIVLVFSFCYYLSNKAKRTFFRLLIIGLSYILLVYSNKDSILVNEDIVIAMGLLVPHIKFIFSFIFSIFESIKNMTANTYFFFVSIYYKILRFFSFIFNIFLVVKGFFTRYKNRDSKESNKQDFRDYGRNTHNNSRKFSSEEEQYSNQSNSDDSYRENQKQRARQRRNDDFRNSNFNYEQETNDFNTQDETYEEIEDIDEEFKRFYSSSAYIVLGVSEDDDFSHIKKSYRALVSIYHPDKNTDNIELYTEITQNINEAYDKLKKIKS